MFYVKYNSDQYSKVQFRSEEECFTKSTSRLVTGMKLQRLSIARAAFLQVNIHYCKVSSISDGQ